MIRPRPHLVPLSPALLVAAANAFVCVMERVYAAIQRGRQKP